MTTWYAQADAGWSYAQWNDQADGLGNSGTPADGDTADANGHAVSIGADGLPQFLTFANGTFTFTADYTFGQGLLQGAFTIASGATLALGTYTHSLQAGWVLNALGLLTLGAGGTLNAYGALLGNVTSDGTINLGAGLGVYPAGTLQIKANEVLRSADIDWPATSDVLKDVAFDNGVKVGTYDASAAIAAAVAAKYADDQGAVLASAECILSGHAILGQTGTFDLAGAEQAAEAAQLADDQAAVLASAEFIVSGHTILDQAGTYQPESTGDESVTIPEDLRELYDEARAQLIVEAERTPKNWPKLTGYASILRAIIADGQVEQPQ